MVCGSLDSAPGLSRMVDGASWAVIDDEDLNVFSVPLAPSELLKEFSANV